MNCLKCDVNMASEGYIQDSIQLCHACYEIEFTTERGRVMNKVIIEVSGGVAHLKSAPKGVDVEIIDFDNAEGESND